MTHRSRVYWPSRGMDTRGHRIKKQPRWVPGTSQPPRDQEPPRATSAADPNRFRGLVRAGLALALISLTWLLLPRAVESAPGVPRDTGSVRQSSVVALYSVYGGKQSSADLSWDWNIKGGKSEATLFAVVRAPNERSYVVLGGPISRLIERCHLDGEPVDPSVGFPEDLGFVPPQNTTFWFGGREPDTIAHFSFQSDMTQSVLRCDVRDFGSDAPPVHRLYTPTLLAYAHGTETATEEELNFGGVCVEVPSYSATEAVKECAEGFEPVPLLMQREQLLNLPEEQGVRDAYLLVVGAVAGIAAAALLELLTGALTKAIHIGRVKLELKNRSESRTGVLKK